MNNNALLKNAFIDAFYPDAQTEAQEFSTIFENRMQMLIQKQKGIYRLVNNVGKRVACLILVIVISLTTVACSVKEIREPIINEIKKFFVNANELLKGTTADEVSEFFPNDVTKIIATDFISETNKQYTIDDEEKVKEFIDLISETYFRLPESYEPTGDYSTYWSFDFYNTDSQIGMKMKMCTNKFSSSRVILEHNGEINNFYISEFMYRKFLSFTNRELYLHDSSLPLPSEDFCNGVRDKAISQLSEEDLTEIKNTVRHVHYSTEAFLLNNVSLLKNSDSIYWKYFIDGEYFTDPITNEKSIFGLYDDYESSIYKGVIADLELLIRKCNNKNMSAKFKYVLNLWQVSAEEHNIEGLFLAHENIHDYDYFLYNFPTHYVYDPAVDYQGVYDYFGHLS